MTSSRCVLITGAYGMLGFHLRARLHVLRGVEVLCAGRDEFADEAALDALVSRAGAVVHLAGVNRGSDEEVESGNCSIAEALVRSLQRVGSVATVVFSSSTHRERDTPYGRSKRVAAETLAAWSLASGGAFHEVVLPHVFGESGRPFYNSVVHTFCHQLATGKALSIDSQESKLELCHAGSVSDAILALLQLRPEAELQGVAQAEGRWRFFGQEATVGDLAELLTRQHEQYFEANELPELSSPFELALFNCLRGAAFPKSYPVPLQLNTDSRGSLFEAVRSRRAGQTFFSTTAPGVTRGNHFHFSKVERFVVVGGKAEIRIRRLFDDKVSVFVMDGANPAYVDMPTLHTHEITNVGDGELMTLFWAHEFFDPAYPDTYAEKVQLEVSAPANQ
ncbi:MAG: NAD-dependent epimerase/dehydratase family protein [Planctomycetes bacterium]|nr:NAD-dependent epimerase/dehydratase family protein [Planctomycetota bacterium]